MIIGTCSRSQVSVYRTIGPLVQYLHLNINILIAIALNESIFLDVLHFPMINIKTCDLETTPIGGATSKPASDVVCLLFWRDVGSVPP